eukprot:m.168559 g.168559  ORF g.168559 m.168559 type:complete len:316 (-) comp24119_c0_seq1:862-1809(-)
MGDKKKKGGDTPVGCAVCGKPNKSQCAGCKQVRYCSSTCQTDHWRRGGHKSACKALRAKADAAASRGWGGDTPTAPPAAAAAVQPGDRVTLHGLVKVAELNGACGVVQPEENWKGERIMVQLDTVTGGRDTVLAKPANFTVLATERCTICLENSPPPIPSGCGCRGSAAFSHPECRVAAARHDETGESWKRCATCLQSFGGRMAVVLALDILSGAEGIIGEPEAQDPVVANDITTAVMTATEILSQYVRAVSSSLVLGAEWGWDRPHWDYSSVCVCPALVWRQIVLTRANAVIVLRSGTVRPQSFSEPSRWHSGS